MASTVFFSWQADTPPRVGRNFLRSVLEDACRALGADDGIDEALRDLEVDSDTQGVAGHPPVVETILRKIDAAAVFVADMTFVAERPDGGRSPNPNVLIEYGWALKALTPQRILCVMNTAYGEPSDNALPFDLQHTRWPTRFNVPEDVSPETRAAEKKRLTKDLTEKLRACLATVATMPEPARRAPLIDVRGLAVAAGWNGDIRAATVGDNDWWSFTQRLRQAAVDGAISFFGRRYLYDFGKETDSEPLIPIPREHFDAFGFDPVQLAQADNYDIFTGTLGESPRSLKGQIFRDLHVNEKQALAWLEAAGRPPAPADMTVRVEAGGAQIGDYKPVCTLIITSIGSKDIDRCLVEMTEFSGVVSADMPMPFVFRTASQIRANDRGRFLLSAGQDAVVPVVFHRPQRANEWYLIDDAGRSYFFSANPTKLIVRIYGGPSPGNALVFIDTDAAWKAMPSVRTVASIFSLRSG